jgi:hypothetical protein
MYGRSRSCLLALSFLALTPGLLHGQSDRPDSERDAPPESALALPRAVQPPDNVASSLSRRLPVPPGTLGFPQVARAAGTIFSGTVTAIARHPAGRGQSVETVAITFRVEEAIRGATPGQDLTISQWMGLWSSGQRYRVGEHVLLFLYPPSKLGLTSCVGGPVGRFTVDPLGRVLLSAQHLSAFRSDPVLGGKSRVRFSDFAWAVRRVSGEE